MTLFATIFEETLATNENSSQEKHNVVDDTQEIKYLAREFFRLEWNGKKRQKES